MANAIDRLISDAEGRSRRRRGARMPAFPETSGAPDVRGVMRENAELRRINAQLRHELARLRDGGGPR